MHFLLQIVKLASQSGVALGQVLYDLLLFVFAPLWEALGPSLGLVLLQFEQLPLELFILFFQFHDAHFALFCQLVRSANDILCHATHLLLKLFDLDLSALNIVS